MKRTLGIFAVGTLLCGAWGAAQGQGLGAAAQREKERRAKVAASEKAKKTFTNDDLQGPVATSEPLLDAATDGASARGSESGASSRDEPGRGESYWRQRFQSARQRVSDAERRVASLEQSTGSRPTIPGPLGPLPPRCGPVPKGEPTKLYPPEGMPGGMSCEEVDEAYETRARLEELLEARRQVESAKKAVEDLEEEARRQRALPGWTR